MRFEITSASFKAAMQEGACGSSGTRKEKIEDTIVVPEASGQFSCFVLEDVLCTLYLWIPYTNEIEH